MRKFFDWLSNLRPRQLLALAGVAAIIIFFLMYIALTMLSGGSRNAPPPEEVEQQQTTEENQTPEIKMVNVVVAAGNIEPRSMLVSNLLETQEMPENMVPQDAVTDIAEVANKPARERIYKGDVITHSKVYQNAAMAGFVGSIPPDCRAVSISINDITGVSGFAKPGDYVDVLLIEAETDKVTSRLLLQDVLLLSINQNMGTGNNSDNNNNNNDNNNNNADSNVNPETTAIANPTMATLALRPEEVMLLVSATKLGDIYLMLRPLVPQSDYITGAQYVLESMKTPPQTETPQTTTPTETPAQQVPAVATIPPENKIEIIYGDESEDKTTANAATNNNTNSPKTSVTP